MPATFKKLNYKHWIIIALFAVTTFHFFFIWYVNHYVYDRVVSFADIDPENTKTSLAENYKKIEELLQEEEAVMPFREIYPFDDDAKSWSNIFSQYMAGALIFDANGDGKLDVYFCQDGQNWTHPTDKSGILAEAPRYQSNVLYLNQGNDESNNPIFAQVKHLAERNDSYVREELLIENFLEPRNSLEDSEERPARQSAVAVAADFNSDGRLDLLVGNMLPGMFWSHPKTQRVLSRVVKPIGREAKNTKSPLSAQGMHFVNYEPRYNLNDKRSSSRGEEFYGANSLFLNMGDKDQDGLPEWKDVSKEAGIEGKRATVSLSVADIDLDGDLDIFEGNIMDTDYWPGGSQYWAGAANQIYINQIAETGELKFVESAAKMGVDGIYDDENPMPNYHRLYKIPFLPEEYSMALSLNVPYQLEYLSINGQETEHGQISWATIFQDVNDDGYPDLWVANDLGFLRLYENKNGTHFVQKQHLRSTQSGMWMTFAPGDFNNDKKEDLFAGNMGSGVLNLAISVPDPREMFAPVLADGLAYQQIFYGKHNSMHALFDGLDYNKSLDHQVVHSRVLPPDTSHLNNIRGWVWSSKKRHPFSRNTLDAYEFAWGSTSFDLQNDGRLDFYYLGGLYGRGGGILAIIGTCPGRLLVNYSSDKQVKFADLTAEHHAFNILELEYDKLDSDNYIYRKAPLQNWSKRDMVYSYDRSAWAVQGPDIQEKVANYDMIQLSENGRVAIAADINNDGYSDLLVRNMGGYDSRSSQSKNLKFIADNEEYVLPAHDYHYPTCTNYDPGTSRMFMNTYSQKNWIKVALTDDSPGCFNRDAIGAKVIINNLYLRIKRSGDGSCTSNRFEDLHFGLNTDTAKEIEIIWPDKTRTKQKLNLKSLKNGTLTISKNHGIIEWRAQ